MSEQLVTTLLDKYGTTFAEQAHITLKNEPSPLFRLLMLCMLQAKPFGADTALQALRELDKEGLSTAEKVHSAARRTMIAAFKRAGYSRYDESSATYLHKAADYVLKEYGGDLRELRTAGNIKKDLQEIGGVGPASADMFAREVQAVWPELAPALDGKALQGAKNLDSPQIRKLLRNW